SGGMGLEGAVKGDRVQFVDMNQAQTSPLSTTTLQDPILAPADCLGGRVICYSNLKVVIISRSGSEIITRSMLSAMSWAVGRPSFLLKPLDMVILNSATLTPMVPPWARMT